MIKYEAAVKECKPLWKSNERNNWRIAEVADELEPKYGERTLARFAKAIGAPYDTIQVYRSVWRAYDKKGPRGPFSVSKELMAHPQREKILKTKPKITYREARKIAQSYSKPRAKTAFKNVDNLTR